jgi:hypothetical protein
LDFLDDVESFFCCLRWSWVWWSWYFLDQVNKAYSLHSNGNTELNSELSKLPFDSISA